MTITEKGSSGQYMLKNEVEPDGNCTARTKFDVATKEKTDELLSERDQPPAEDSEDELCNICFTDPANTVLLDCGHGSICVNCAIDSMKKNNHCIFCRAKVLQIIEIDTKEVRKGLFKVVNSYYVSEDG